LGAQFKAETNAVRQQTTFKSWLANRENGFQLVSLAALLQLHTQREKSVLEISKTKFHISFI